MMGLLFQIGLHWDILDTTKSTSILSNPVIFLVN